MSPQDAPDPIAAAAPEPASPPTEAGVEAGVDATVTPGSPAPTPPPAAKRSRGRGIAIVVGALLVVLAGSALFLSGWSLGRQEVLTPGTPVDEAQAFQPFWDTYRAVTDRYAGGEGELDRKKVIEGAIKGMIASLDDPYSMYLTSDEFKASLQGISGEFEGIGTTIGVVDAKGSTASCDTLGPDCRMAIIAPIKGSPAEAAGLQPGDVITKIDGVDLTGEKLDEARAKIRGAKDTTVTLTIVRAGGAPFEVPITRAVIVSPEVDARDLANGTVGYIKLSGFSDHAAEQLDAAVVADVKAGKKAIILDLRGNPGGFVTAAREIASQFLADGTIFWEEDASGHLQETVAKPGGVATDPAIKLVVLVDGGSASASEIVAGALHDRGRAQLVGTKTFGKGTVQQWTQLEEDSGGFRLTVAKWLTPDKTWVHGKGIFPDVVVDTAPARPGDDPALTRALELLDAPAALPALRFAA